MKPVKIDTGLSAMDLALIDESFRPKITAFIQCKSEEPPSPPNPLVISGKKLKLHIKKPTY